MLNCITINLSLNKENAFSFIAMKMSRRAGNEEPISPFKPQIDEE